MAMVGAPSCGLVRPPLAPRLQAPPPAAISTIRSRDRCLHRLEISHFRALSSPQEGSSSDGSGEVDELRLPDEWTNAAAAAQEAEWLRGRLHKWLDDEYCPEPSNVEISKRCASVYYRCLVEKELDAGNILMEMVHNLEGFSFKESFHGAFSSANAAMDLILGRMRETDN